MGAQRARELQEEGLQRVVVGAARSHSKELPITSELFMISDGRPITGASPPAARPCPGPRGSRCEGVMTSPAKWHAPWVSHTRCFCAAVTWKFECEQNDIGFEVLVRHTHMSRDDAGLSPLPQHAPKH